MSDREVPPGFYAPVYRSLTEPMLLAGLPPQLTICLGVTAGVFVGAWHFYLLIPVLVVAYVAAFVATKRDPYFFDIVLQNRGRGPYLP